MALIAAHLNAGHPGGDSVAIGIYTLPLPPPPYPLLPILPVPNKPYGFCGHKASCLLTIQHSRANSATAAAKLPPWDI